MQILSFLIYSSNALSSHKRLTRSVVSWAQGLCSTGDVGVPWLHSCPAWLQLIRVCWKDQVFALSRARYSLGCCCVEFVLLDVALDHGAEADAAPALPSLQCGGSEFLVLFMALSCVLFKVSDDWLQCPETKSIPAIQSSGYSLNESQWWSSPFLWLTSACLTGRDRSSSGHSLWQWHCSAAWQSPDSTAMWGIRHKTTAKTERKQVNLNLSWVWTPQLVWGDFPVRVV